MSHLNLQFDYLLRREMKLIAIEYMKIEEREMGTEHNFFTAFSCVFDSLMRARVSSITFRDIPPHLKVCTSSVENLIALIVIPVCAKGSLTLNR